jgi:hypothetical protein
MSQARYRGPPMMSDAISKAPACARARKLHPHRAPSQRLRDTATKVPAAEHHRLGRRTLARPVRARWRCRPGRHGGSGFFDIAVTSFAMLKKHRGRRKAAQIRAIWGIGHRQSRNGCRWPVPTHRLLSIRASDGGIDRRARDGDEWLSISSRSARPCIIGPAILAKLPCAVLTG